MADDRGSRLQEFVAHGADVNCCTIGKNSGRVVATGGEDRKVNIWTLGNPTASRSLSGHTSGVEAVEFDGREEMVVAGSASGSLKLWGIEEGKSVRTLTGHKSNIRSLDFHPFGEFIASGSMDTNLKVWDVRRRGCIQTYKGHSGPVDCVRFSPDGRWVVSGADVVKLWDLTAGKLLHEFKLHTGNVSCLEFHPNEFLLATGSSDRTVKFWDLETFNLVSSSPAESSKIRSMSFDPAGTALYTGSQDKMHAYGWEPSSRFDTVSMGWGRVDDIHAVDSSRLVGINRFQTNVAIWLVDLDRVSKTAEGGSRPGTSACVAPPRGPVSNENEPPSEQTVVMPNRRPPTGASDKGGGRRKPLKGGQQGSRSRLPIDDVIDSTDDPFARKPKIPAEPGQHQAAAAAASAGPRHRATTAPAPADSDARLAQGKTVVLDPAGARVPAAALAAAARAPPPSRQKQGRRQQAAPTPAADQVRRVAHDHQRDQQHHSSPIVPSSRDKPFNLDVNAFLPAAASPSVSPSDTTEADALAAIHSGNSSMMAVLNARLRNVKIARNHWEAGNTKKSIAQLVELQDHAALIDVMNVLERKPNLWSLDLAVAALPAFPSLLQSQYEHYVTTTCNAGILICKSFTQLILANVNRPSGFVDVTREERHEKCAVAHKHLKQCRAAIQGQLRQTGKIGSVARKLDQSLGAFQ